MKSTEIILVRHGQSLGNAKNLYLGHTDLDLSEEGYRQAEIAALALRSEKITAVYSSDLLRAHNTAVPHAQMRALDVNDRVGLREVFLGDWEGLPIAEIEEKWHNEFINEWKGNFGISTPPGGESVLKAGERMYNEVLSIARENAGGCVLIASHAAVIRSFWGRVAKIAPEELASRVPFPKNASFTRVHFDGENLNPVCYSDDRHFNVSTGGDEERKAEA